MLTLLLALLVPCAAAASVVEGVSVELPDGAAARVQALIGPETRPHPLPAALAQPAPWSRGATWELWAATVAEEAAAERPDPERRARLALLAHAQARDPWAHFAALGGDPAWAASVRPYLLPGIAPEFAPGAGTRAEPLPDGALLHPALPPLPENPQALGHAPLHALASRSMRIAPLFVGNAELALRISVESSGVEVEVEHLSGGSARLHVLLPEPDGYAIGIEYVDWMRRDELRVAHLIEVFPPGSPEAEERDLSDEPRSLWGRVLERDEALPRVRAAGGALPAQLAQGGLWLAHDVSLDAGERALVAAAGRGFAHLFSIPVQVEALAGTAAAGARSIRGWTGTEVRLPAEAAARARMLAALAASAEVRALP